MRLLMTGASGLLGRHLKKYLKIDFAPDEKRMDITNAKQVERYLKKTKPDLVFHAAAYTDVAGAEKNKKKAYKVNVLGSRNIYAACQKLNIPCLYISTDYVFNGTKGRYKENDPPNPINYYALTKLLGENPLVSKIIRTSFKPWPFEHPRACVDMYTSAEYVDKIARELALAIKNYQKLPPIIHIAGKRKSLYDLAKKSNPKVGKIKRADIKDVNLPYDVSLNISVWKKIKRNLKIKRQK